MEMSVAANQACMVVVCLAQKPPHFLAGTGALACRHADDIIVWVR